MKQGELLLVPFPFSDQSGRKVRPVVVVSNETFNKNSDLIVVGVTSNLTAGDITLHPAMLDEGVLHDVCFVKVSNILKIDKRLVIKKIGKINKDTTQRIIQRIHEIIH